MRFWTRTAREAFINHLGRIMLLDANEQSQIDAQRAANTINESIAAARNAQPSSP